jgi:plastocyanin
MRALPLALASIAVALPLTAAAPAAGQATTADVQIGDNFFAPIATSIAPGDSVRWTNGGSSTHTVTSDTGAPESFDSGDLLAGQVFTRAFPTAGRFPYHCTIHPSMQAVVVVAAPGTLPPPLGPGAPTAPRDTVRPSLSRLKLVRGERALRVSFRLSEGARVSARIARESRPRKAVRRLAPRRLRDGARSMAVRIADLAPGRYRVTLTAVDPARNTHVVVRRFRIPAGR